MPSEEQKDQHSPSAGSLGYRGGGAAPSQSKEAESRVDFTRATHVTPELAEAIIDCFEYHPWDAEQTRRGNAVREVLANAVNVLVDNVPPSADRSAAIRKLREARMDANSAITHAGRF